MSDHVAAHNASTIQDAAKDGALNPPPAHYKRSRLLADLDRGVQQELHMLEILKANFAAHHESLDDPDLLMALVEGETSLIELLDLMLEADLEDEGLIEGLKRNKDTLAVRLHRISERRESRRAIIEQALVLMERRRLQRPLATITLSDRAPILVVEEEGQIPARFFDLKPVLNRRLAKVALEAGEEIPGARLSNGTITLTVRRR